jgi:hypothetical protein
MWARAEVGGRPGRGRTFWHEATPVSREVLDRSSLSEHTGTSIGTDLLDKVVEHIPTVTQAYVDAGFKDNFVIHGAVG